MSEFHVEVVRLGEIVKHPNADTLGIVKVRGDYPVIIRLGEFKEGDLAVYVPIDAEVPEGDPRWAFLGKHRRIRAARLRKIFSMGILTPALPGWTEGQNVQAELQIKKWEPAVDFGIGDNEKDPGFLPVYTDLESLRRYPDLLQEGEEVVLTEKLHGCNGRFVYLHDRLWIGSHRCIKKLDGDGLWASVARRYELETRLQAIPGIAVYGEVYGQVQDLTYGADRNELRLALFDALDLQTRAYLDYDAFLAVAAKV